MNYEQGGRFGYNSTNFNLSRMTRLLSALGNPHRKFKTVHIAGTKGKGSTAAMLSSMLQNCNLKVGLYTSPHILSVCERISIHGTSIPEARFTRLVHQVSKVKLKSGSDAITYFEALTAVAFLYFAAEKVDVAIIEAGLGGRLDSTNVIRPEVCGITSISLDHTEQLGMTLAAIAEEKAGIMKQGVTVISAPQRLEAKNALRSASNKAKAPLRFTGEDIEFSYRFESSRAFGPHTRLCLTTPDSRFEHVHVPLLGEHQAINCSVALALVDALKQRGFPIDDQQAIEGLASVRLDGRMEMICDDPRIMVDGAHNAASVNALMRGIGQNVPYDSMIVIFGCQRDKDVAGMLRHIQLGADKVIFTGTGSPRAMDPHDLAATYVEQCGKMAQVAEDLEEAIRIAGGALTREDLICITGSFYLVGKAKRLYGRT
ncbi:MAG: bifunctional folylpolyglutamate synthase/dihydrofolate synthase [Phycisphaerales bacterium]|nr:MAG: bifunctional folylpolyglutamate synthase/dihydrofolate synthase [Phycisphaerales bacterium]